MKQIMILAAVAITAIATQAASVSWTTDAFFTPGTDGAFTETKTARGTVTGYLWEIADAATYAIYASDTSKIYAEFGKEGYGALGAATASATSTSTRKVALDGTTDWAVGDTAYALVLYTYNDGTKDWYIANAAKYDGMDSLGVTVSSLNGYKGGLIGEDPQGAAITGWSTAVVPEPTSGLLLLIGVAGLALRRKQK